MQQHTLSGLQQPSERPEAILLFPAHFSTGQSSCCLSASVAGIVRSLSALSCCASANCMRSADGIADLSQQRSAYLGGLHIGVVQLIDRGHIFGPPAAA